MKSGKNQEISAKIQKLRHPLVIIAILLIALFYAIFMHASGLGILAIIVAIVILFVAYDNEHGTKEFFKSIFSKNQD